VIVTNPFDVKSLSGGWWVLVLTNKLNGAKAQRPVETLAR